MRVEDIQPLCLKVSYLLRKEMSLLRPNLLVSKLLMNCGSVSFLCLVFLKLPFKIYIYMHTCIDQYIYRYDNKVLRNTSPFFMILLSFIRNKT